ncbi:outer membrane protein transport protein [Parabacteroides sp. PF5-6]|uniref:OmpP1/FadL family transporter n=1 Tax=Parabacteroides sp. PF5-6 TaxID=1742403 RepID=UPI002406E97C|nr:outer membrane protein transport protein [Parabacteroides sp. PF5-6]
MKRFGIILVALTLCGSVAFSQGMLEAYRFGQTDLHGTARYMSMGGAFGALGGDISAMSKNPAGLAVYRTSEVVTTMSVTSAQAKTDWLGVSMDKTKTRFNFDNIAYVGYFPTGRDEGVIGWNAGFAYNRVKSFHRNYSMRSGGNLDTSLSDYMAARAYGNHKNDLLETTTYNPYNSVSDWLSVLGYEAGFMDAYSNDPESYYSSFNDRGPNGPGAPYGIDDALLNVYESGAIDKYDLSFGLNISDIVLLGGTFSVTDINYDMSSSYDELFSNDNYLYLDNGLSTDGSGYSFNVGAIVRPTDFLRLGVAYNSPTWYKMTDYYYANAGAYLTWNDSEGQHERDWEGETPTNKPYTDYEFRSPDKWIFSIAGIIGQSALISLDYEMTNYKNMKMYDLYGEETPYYSDVNGDISNNFKMGNTIRLGAEVRVTPQFSVRAGGSFTDSPVKDPFKNNEITVYTVGTVPHYTVDKGSSSYTIGFGYRFTPQFYTDLACVLTSYKEDAYAFSSIIENTDANQLSYVIKAQPASLKTNRTRVALTFGYKF